MNLYKKDQLLMEESTIGKLSDSKWIEQVMIASCSWPELYRMPKIRDVVYKLNIL